MTMSLRRHEPGRRLVVPGDRDLTRCCVIPTSLHTRQSRWNGIPQQALISAPGRTTRPYSQQELQ
jgi:hypothetical protein